jgi:hypothetical protein
MPARMTRQSWPQKAEPRGRPGEQEVQRPHPQQPEHVGGVDHERVGGDRQKRRNRVDGEDPAGVLAAAIAKVPVITARRPAVRWIMEVPAKDCRRRAELGDLRGSHGCPPAGQAEIILGPDVVREAGDTAGDCAVVARLCDAVVEGSKDTGVGCYEGPEADREHHTLLPAPARRTQSLLRPARDSPRPSSSRGRRQRRRGPSRRGLPTDQEGTG